MDLDTDPCHCIGKDSGISLRVSWSWDLTMAPVIGLATYNRLLLSTLRSPIPSFFTMFKLLYLHFSPI